MYLKRGKKKRIKNGLSLLEAAPVDFFWNVLWV